MSEANQVNPDVVTSENENKPTDTNAAIQVNAKIPEEDQPNCCSMCLSFCCQLIGWFLLVVVVYVMAKDQTFLGKWKGTLAPDYGSQQMLHNQHHIGQGKPNLELEGIEYWRPMVASGQPLNFNCWVSFIKDTRFWNDGYHLNPDLDKQLVWEKNDWSLTFDSSYDNVRQLNLSLPLKNSDALEDLSQIHSKNKTLFLHCEFYTPDIYDIQNDFVKGKIEDMSIKTFQKSIPLIVYKQIKKKKKTKKLHQIEQNKTQEEQKPINYTIFYPHLLTNLEVAVVQDFTKYDKNGLIPREVFGELEFEPSIDAYQPIIHLNSFWQLNKHLVVVNDTLDHLNLTLKFQNIPLWHFQFQWQMNFQTKLMMEMGLEAFDLNEIITVWTETDKVLLIVTLIVSVLHTIFEWLAFSSDIKFWNQKKDMIGVSVRTLWFRLIQRGIILLYLLDNDTSWSVMGSIAFSITLSLWKIKKASKITSSDTFPWFKFSDVNSHKESKTKEYDQIAMGYMKKAAIPLIIGYSIYSYMYNEHKGYYSFVINTLVGCIYTFGFINMMPQLYINYRLKSVAHLNNNALMFTFLNTIIDDLFSFIVEMPTMQRLSCFRDDFIFVIYMYQRWIYKVDPTRNQQQVTNEDGDSGADENTGQHKIGDNDQKEQEGESKKDK